MKALRFPGMTASFSGDEGASIIQEQRRFDYPTITVLRLSGYDGASMSGPNARPASVPCRAGARSGQCSARRRGEALPLRRSMRTRPQHGANLSNCRPCLFRPPQLPCQAGAGLAVPCASCPIRTCTGFGQAANASPAKTRMGRCRRRQPGVPPAAGGMALGPRCATAPTFTALYAVPNVRACIQATIAVHR